MFDKHQIKYHNALKAAKMAYYSTVIRIYIQDGAEYGSRVASSEKTLQFFLYVLLVFLLYYVLDVVSITVYDRHTLLNIGSSVTQRKPDFEFLFTDTASEPFVWAARPVRPRLRKRSRKRGKRAGVLVRLRCRPL